MQSVKSKLNMASLLVKVKRIAIYLRVSTDEQENNTSKKSQLATIETYIFENGFKIEEKFIYEDTYSASRSPKKNNFNNINVFYRPGMKDLIFDASLKKFDAVFVYSHDRLTRNMAEAMLLKQTLQMLDIELIYCRSGENLNSENKELERFFDNFQTLMAEMESNKIGSRVKLGTRYDALHGVWPGGPPPYGYKLVKFPFEKKEKSVFEIVYSEARVVRDIFKLYILGNAPEDIAKIIKNKYPNNADDRKWTKNTIKSILANEDYIGHIVYDKKGGVRNPIKHTEYIRSERIHEEIIDKEMWEQVQNLKRMQNDDPKYLSSNFLLKGLLYCKICGNVLKAKNNGGSRGRVYYCDRQNGKWETCVSADMVERKAINSIEKFLGNRLAGEEQLNALYKQYVEGVNKLETIYNKQNDELNKKIGNAEQVMDNSKEEIKNLEKEIQELQKIGKDGDLTIKKKRVLIESIKELQTSLCIKENLLKNSLIDVKKECQVQTQEAFGKLITENGIILESFKRIEDTKTYQRSMRILFINLISRIDVTKDNNEISLDIIFK